MKPQKPFYRRPKPQAVLILVGGLLFYAYLTFFRLGGLQPNALAIAADVVLLVAGLVVWMAFFSQFVLPVSQLEERRKALNRLINYLMGNHGPAIFIKNGEIQHRSQEMQRRGPGVIILDTASAAVLRNPVAFTRPVGPGIVFIEASEYLAGTVDLHLQNERIGPHEAEDPFQAQHRDESKEAYHRRQERRWETSGLTRDGVEVVPAIAASFRLDSEPGEGGTLFGYSPKAVWRAIGSEGVDPNAPRDAHQRHIPWKWLPVYLAADVWREYLRKFTLNQLFDLSSAPVDPRTGDPARTVFEWLETLVFQRLTQAEVIVLDAIGRPTGETTSSREFSMLQNRGIQIEEITISNLHFPSSVEKELVRQWKATWLDRAQQESHLVERRRSFGKLAGEESALLEFGDAASQYLGPIVLDNINMPELLPDLKDSLEFLVRGSLNQCIRDPELPSKLTTEKTHLVELIEWIRRQ